MYTHMSIYRSTLAFCAPKNVNYGCLFINKAFAGACNESVNKQLYNGKYTYLPKIKTHGSKSQGQEEAGRMQQTSELFRHSTAVKFVNALNKPP